MRPQPVAPRQGLRENVIVFTVSGFRFAIAAGAVSEIRSTEGLERVLAAAVHRPHQSMAKVDYTLQRNGVTYFVVSAADHFGLPPGKPSRVLVLRHAAVGVLVDSTDRMTEISLLHSLPMAFTQDERHWYRGLVVLNGEVLPVVSSAAFLSKEEEALLRTAVQPGPGVAVV